MAKVDIALFEWPLVVECGRCGGKLEIYPRPEPRGTALCRNYHGDSYPMMKARAIALSIGYPGFEERLDK